MEDACEGTMDRWGGRTFAPWRNFGGQDGRKTGLHIAIKMPCESSKFDKWEVADRLTGILGERLPLRISSIEVTPFHILLFLCSLVPCSNLVF